MPDTHNYLRSRELLSKFRCRLVVIDVQEKLAPVVWERERVVSNCTRPVQGANLQQVPVEATEQYPSGLGPTIEPLASLIPQRHSKMRFSSVECLDWPTAASCEDGRTQVVLCGMEAHVCVLQTAYDLLAAGYQVHVVADAVSSRRELDWLTALQRLQLAGAVIVTTESVLFEWCETAEDSAFKTLISIVKPKL